MKKILSFTVLTFLFVAPILFSAIAKAEPPLPPQAATHDFKITSLSTRPEYVSGGDVLIRIDVPRIVPLHQVTVALNGADITNAFRVDKVTRSLLGLVQGLKLGDNTLAVNPNGLGKGRPSAQMILTNYPIIGPILSGPHEEPFICQTHQFRLFPNGPFLTASQIVAPCSIPTRFDYVYQSTTGEFKAFNPAGPRPPDLAQATVEGQTVPYIVRIETGTINRAIYQISMLVDPRGPSPDPWTRSPGWNGRLIFKFGGGCNSGWYRQGSTVDSILEDKMLKRGFALASSSLNVYGNNCNDLLSAETMMMVKERFIEAYGLPLNCIGWGCSGGSYQGHQIGDNYPGLLDGIVVGCSFSEVVGEKANYLTDTYLLKNYFDTANARGEVTWSVSEQLAVHGAGVFGQIANMSSSSLRFDPIPGNFNAIVPSALRYNPVTNPFGARGEVWDHMVNTFGRDPVTEFALRPLDNVGVQYGLAALNTGKITKTQFFDLNEKIGGLDIEYNVIPERTVYNAEATRRAYQGGRILNGGGGLASMPIINFTGYVDDVPEGNAHTKYNAYQTRERLIRANGHADNHVMLVVDGYCPEGEQGGCALFSLLNPVLEGTIDQMNQWLSNIKHDLTDDPLAIKVVRNKPVDLVDACWEQNGAYVGNKIVEKQTFYGGRCNELYPTYPTPRMNSGERLGGDIVKCHLKRIDYGDYNVPFTAEEKGRLEKIFSTGVCDWSKPGVDQVPLVLWGSFGPSPENLIFDVTR